MPSATDGASLRTAGHQRRAVAVHRVRTAIHRRGPIAFVVLLAALQLWARCGQIDASLPYPRQVDEAYLTAPASRILTQNDFDPGWFRYPSLPIYLTSAAMALGFIQSAKRGEIATPGEIGSVGLPYYAHASVVAPARHLFAIASVVAIVLYALIAARLVRRRWVAPLVVAVMGGSAHYLELSWMYLNVDILGAAMTAAALALSLGLLDVQSGALRGFLPGLLAGLSASCKYNCGLVLGATLVALVLGTERSRRLGAAWLALGGVAMGFLLGTPYSLLNVRRFLTDVGYEAHHYALGHSGFSGEPGGQQLLTYAAGLVNSFGFRTLPWAAVGLIALLRMNPRGACVLFTFPALLLAFLCRFRVQFARNALALHGIYAILVAFGIWAGAKWFADTWPRWWARQQLPTARARAALALGIALTIYATALDWSGLRGHFVIEGDSRVRAAAWLGARIPPGSVVVMPVELGVDPRSLTGITFQQLKVLSYSNAAEFKTAVADMRATHLLWPEWGRDLRFGGKSALERAQALAPAGEELARFGKQAVLVNYPRTTVPWGNPAFAVMRLKP